jgi:4-hydroxy-2-oxoheptanedioate aldolase
VNAIESQMVGLLRTMRTDYGATAVKASMEAEGILLNEMLRLKEIVMAAGSGLSVKIGGCEALTDARLAKGYGVCILLAPMIESRFALEKFLDMAQSVFSEEEREGMQFYINIETLEGLRNIGEILAAKNVPLLDAIVLGRTDLRSALKAENVDCPAMLEAAREVFGKAKEQSLRCIVGGGISEKTIPFLSQLGELVDGFETRKVVFADAAQEPGKMREAILLALHFELLWYRLRQQIYLPLYEEDLDKMKKIEDMLNL